MWNILGVNSHYYPCNVFIDKKFSLPAFRHESVDINVPFWFLVEKITIVQNTWLTDLHIYLRKNGKVPI